MPALLEFTFLTEAAQPRGLLGIPLHGLIFGALEHVDAALSAGIHAASIKPFRVGQAIWEDGEGPNRLTFQVGVLDDRLVDILLTALTPGRVQGEAGHQLVGAIDQSRILVQESHEDMYARHALERGSRHIQMAFLTPTTFRTTDMDMPFPVPRTVFYGLQRRWEAFSDLHFGPELNDWIGRSVRVQEFRLHPRSVYFKGMRDAALTACVGDVRYQIARPGDAEPTFVRLLAEYANYTGVGYKTTFGLGHVQTSS
jgi:CRISPR-associated endoribonuclease Cas6